MVKKSGEQVLPSSGLRREPPKAGRKLSSEGAWRVPRRFAPQTLRDEGQVPTESRASQQPRQPRRRQGVLPAGTIGTTRSIGSGAVLPAETSVTVHAIGLQVVGRDFSDRIGGVALSLGCVVTMVTSRCAFATFCPQALIVLTQLLARPYLEPRHNYLGFIFLEVTSFFFFN